MEKSFQTKNEGFRYSDFQSIKNTCRAKSILWKSLDLSSAFRESQEGSLGGEGLERIADCEVEGYTVLEFADVVITGTMVIGGVVEGDAKVKTEDEKLPVVTQTGSDYLYIHSSGDCYTLLIR